MKLQNTGLDCQALSREIRQLSLLLFATVFCAVAHVASYYVDPAGSDANDGLGLSTPFKTIGKAASVVAAGDIGQFSPAY